MMPLRGGLLARSDERRDEARNCNANGAAKIRELADCSAAAQRNTCSCNGDRLRPAFHKGDDQSEKDKIQRAAVAEERPRDRLSCLTMQSAIWKYQSLTSKVSVPFLLRTGYEMKVCGIK
uniref:Uncharacterized protein n=1 Tax=Trichuris muris TaxID=70415 RepID=A0A5S6QX17_TRIMR